MLPETRYTKSGDLHIAYQVVGDGGLDLVIVPGFVSHLDAAWEEPSFAHFYNQLSSFSRLILFDKRGTGLSDRVPDTAFPTLEQRMDDVRAVMDAVGSSRAALMGISEGAPMSMLFAATYPDRVSALILYGAISKGVWAEDYPWGSTYEEWEEYFEAIPQTWGTTEAGDEWAPSQANNERFKQWRARYLRLGASPGAVIALWRMNREIDVRHVLSTIRIPTLVLHRAGDQAVEVEQGRYTAEHIPNAKFVELPGDDHLWFVGDSEAIVSEVELFLTGTHRAPDPSRVLATVLFTDIVGSTERAVELGDYQWRQLLSKHNDLMRTEIDRAKGRFIKSMGDGVLATFDGPGRGIACACAARDSVKPLGIEIRAGLHTGEIELIQDDVGGIAIHTAARVCELARPSEVVVSSTVKDLVAGSGFQFFDRGAHALKGLAEEARLFSVLP
jgi:class 3 adenylate cyclase